MTAEIAMAYLQGIALIGFPLGLVAGSVLGKWLIVKSGHYRP
jgi:hypothetical protein